MKKRVSSVYSTISVGCTEIELSRNLLEIKTKVLGRDLS